MAQSPDPARVHRVTPDAKGTELASKASSGAMGPLTLEAYLFSFDAPRQPPAYPAQLAVAIYPGRGVDLSLVFTVTAAATEIQYPEYPTQTGARFLTNHLGYEQPRQAGENPPGQAIGVGFGIEGQPNSPLRFGIMATFGKQAPAPAPAEPVPPSAPPVLRAAYRVVDRQPLMVDVYKDLNSRPPHRRTKRPLHAISAQGGEPIGAVISGPFKVTNYLFCSANENQWLRPGFNTLWMDLRELGIGTVWTVNAAVSELAPPDHARTGDALFFTLGAQLDMRNQRAFVYCYLDWKAALPVAVMMTIGYG